MASADDDVVGFGRGCCAASTCSPNSGSLPGWGLPAIPTVPIVGGSGKGYVGFETSLNTGALFGLGQGMVLGFAALSIVAIAGLLYWFFCWGAAQQLGLTLTLAPDPGRHPGQSLRSAGNVACRRRGDALFRRGGTGSCYVTATGVWPTSTWADSYLVCGAALLAWWSFRTPAEFTAQPDTTSV